MTMKLALDIEALCLVLRAAIQADRAIGGMIHKESSAGCTCVAVVDLPDAFAAAFGDAVPGDGTSVSEACTERRRVTVRDVRDDAGSEPYRATAARAGVVAMQSTPIGNDGNYLYGVLTTCFDRPHHPTPHAMAVLDCCARIAAKIIQANALEQRAGRSTRPRVVSDDEVARASAAVEALLPVCVQDPSLELLEAAEKRLGMIVAELARRAGRRDDPPDAAPPIGKIDCG